MFIKIDTAHLFFCVILIYSLIYGIKEGISLKNSFSLLVDRKLLIKNSSYLLVNLDHEYGSNLTNMQLKLKITNRKGQYHFQNISDLGNESIKHQIQARGQQINNVFIQSQQPLRFQKNGRILQSTDQSASQLSGLVVFLTYFFGCGRNIIILATVTGSFDVWSNFLIFIQIFTCLGFWTHDTHLFTQIYKNIFKFEYDVFNFVRFYFSAQSELSSNSFLALYGFTNKFAINCCGQLIGFLLVMISVGIIKLLTVIINSQRIRSLGPKLRPICNGYIFWMSPRILSLAGLSLRSLPESLNFLQVLQLLVSVIMIVIIVIFFIVFVIQIRKISGDIEYIDERRRHIGLADRIDYYKQFQFDCLSCSILYYPAMNLARIIFSHLCIGFAPDFHYVQFGGVFIGQIFYTTIQICCPGNKIFRDRFLYIFSDFTYGLFELCLVGIGLVYSVGYLQLTIILQKIGFSLVIVITSILSLQIILDIIRCFRTCGSQKDQKLEDPNTMDKNQQIQSNSVFKSDNKQVLTDLSSSKSSQNVKQKYGLKQYNNQYEKSVDQESRYKSVKKIKKIKDSKYI